MKFTTNFAPPLDTFVRPLAVAAWATALVSALLTGWLVLDAAAQREALPPLSARVEALRGRLAGMNAAALPGRTELLDLKQRVAALNRLPAGGGLRLPALLQGLEAALPDEAYVASLRYDRAQRVADVVAHFTRPDRVQPFLDTVQRGARYGEVLVMREQALQAEGRTMTRIELRFTETAP